MGRTALGRCRALRGFLLLFGPLTMTLCSTCLCAYCGSGRANATMLPAAHAAVVNEMLRTTRSAARGVQALYGDGRLTTTRWRHKTDLCFPVPLSTLTDEFHSANKAVKHGQNDSGRLAFVFSRRIGTWDSPRLEARQCTSRLYVFLTFLDVDIEHTAALNMN